MRSIFVIVVFTILMVVYNHYRQLKIQNFVYYGLLILTTVICIVKGIKENYVINPYFLFTIVPISLLMYDLSVSTHYLVSLRDDTYELAIYNICMALLGLFIGQQIHFGYSNTWNKSINQMERHLAKHAKIMMLIGMIPTLYGCIFGASYLISMNLNELKSMVNSAPLASIFQLFLYLGIMCALKSRDKKTTGMCLSALVFSIILNFSKTTVVMMCICLIIYFYDLSLINPKVRKYFLTVVLGALILTFASFTIYNNIRFDYDINGYFDDLGYVGNISQTWFLPIMYVISPWSNLQYIVDTTAEYTHGLWLLKPILSYLQIDGLWADSFELVPRYQAFNTYTFISVYYRDFGFIGSGICSFVLATYIIYIYKLKKRFPNSPHISTIFALNMYATVMMFFNNHFQQLSYPFTIFIITWLWLKVTKADYVEDANV